VIVATQVSGGASALPLDAALAILPSLPRPVLSRLVTRMIERLDEIDGDAEGEEDNEDCGHDEGEPDYRRPHWRLRKWAGPGCRISDEDHGAEEIGEPEDGIAHPAYGIDQTTGPLSLHTH
jgi:hypothetical protein